MKGGWYLSYPAAALACGLAFLVAAPARGAPLDPQTCELLQLKLDDLRKLGVETDMALGVETARTTLPIERFNRIGVYIETEEQLNFRCGLAKQRIILPTTVEGGEEELPGAAETATEGAPGTPPLPQRAPREAKDAAASKASSAAKSPAAAVRAPAEGTKRRPAVAKAKEGWAPTAKPAATEGEPRKAAKKKAARKTDDAYRPPPKPAAGEENASPTAKQ